MAVIPVRFAPLPRPAGLPLMRSRFKAGWGDTFGLLQHELAKLDAQNVIIEAGFDAGQLRNDGWPRSGCRASHPAVRISFTSKGKSLAFPCDRYSDHWDNIRAIALSLEALRAVDRYGVTQQAEQYKGWAQLEAPASAALTEDEAAAFFFTQAVRFYGQSAISIDQIRGDSARFEQLYRMLAKRLHPDLGGDRKTWDRLQVARDVLRVAHQRRAG